MIKMNLKPALLGLTIAILAANASAASNVSKRLNDMGGDKELMKKAKAVDSQNRFRIVQKREVDRSMRLEVGANYGMNAGGDSYINTSSIGANVDFHITPRWSFGARYYSHNNDLTSEGKRVFDEAEKNGQASGYAIRATDYPLSTTLGVVSFYPLYGKINWFDAATTQFDMYVLAGGGQMKLKSGATSTWTAGGGIGMWLSQHIASRLEVRYQSYQDEIYSGSRDQGIVVSTLSVGILL